MKIFLAVIIAIHAAIHLLGFMKAFKLATIKHLSRPNSKVNGILWLLASLLFFTSIPLFLLDWEFWWVIAAMAIIISQSSIVVYWKNTAGRTIVHYCIVIPMMISFSGCSSGYYDTYKAEAEKRLQTIGQSDIVTVEEIAHLPQIVQRYLRYTGAVGKPRVYNFHIVFSGEMKKKIDADWMKITAQQYDFFDDRARLFYISSSMYGIPYDGLHKYIGDSATMQIQIAGLFKVVDAKGDTMNQAETVTLFNDMCIFAPSTLIDRSIQWQEIDSLSVKATFTNRKQTISATLFFNQHGELIDFSSNDRFLSEDGITYNNYRWSTPILQYQEINGRKIGIYAEAIWHLPEGKFSYARFHTDTIEYNCNTFK